MHAENPDKNIKTCFFDCLDRVWNWCKIKVFRRCSFCYARQHTLCMRILWCMQVGDVCKRKEIDTVYWFNCVWLTIASSGTYVLHMSLPKTYSKKPFKWKLNDTRLTNILSNHHPQPLFGTPLSRFFSVLNVFNIQIS